MDFFSDTPTDIGFIVLRNVIDSNTNEYWKLSYRCIRKFYPNNYIIIVDDNSNYNFIDLHFQENLYNAHVIRSDYPARGEILPYYYFLKTNIFEKAVILHDSVFLNSRINTTIKDYKFLWSFKSDTTKYHGRQKNMLAKLKNSKELTHFFDNNINKLQACFGCMTIMTRKYLNKINNRYDIFRLFNVIHTRNDRMFFEVVLACILQYEHVNNALFGDIKKFCKWELKYEDIIKDINDLSKIKLPLIKVWTGR
tara:strand:+ start:282 stop:1037 length:756 start_codon:yes stop_codon:yes gene_type:complete